MDINQGEKKRIHLIGIGGAGMGGIAEVLGNLGHKVSGSDLGANAVTARLASLGAQIFIGHDATNIEGADIVVISTAVPEDNPELMAAKQNNVAIFPRAKMLAQLMHVYDGIGVAGTHGKTTTTSLLASVLAEGGLDPTFVIGGLVKSVGANAQLGQSRYFVAEADESDASFLMLDPNIAIVTNIDADHLGTYHNDMQELYQAFIDYLAKIPADGLQVLCGDDAGVQKIKPSLRGNVVFYGFDDGNDIQASDFRQDGLVSYFTVFDRLRDAKIEIKLATPGRHNALNALAAYAVGAHLGVQPDAIAKAFQEFQGVGRRFQILGEFAANSGSVTVIDDYGHHPTELAATIDAVRQVWPEKRLVMAFQPHRYSRTSDLMDEFIDVLHTVDQLVLLDIYPACEQPIPGVSGEALADKVSQRANSEPVFVAEIGQLSHTLAQTLQDGDVVLLQGAGNIGAYASEVAKNPKIFSV